MSKSETLDIQNERDDIYRKNKNTFDFLASIVDDAQNSLVHRIRAAKSLSTLAKTLRFYMLDEEKMGELEKRLKELEKTIGFTEENNKHQ